MKRKFIILALLLACPPAFGETDCSKTQDACAAGNKKISPFVAASLRESTPPHIEAAAKKVSSTAVAASSTAVAASSAAIAPVPAGIPVEPGGRLSSPAWLLLVIAGFAGLYFYLREGKKKRKSK